MFNGIIFNKGIIKSIKKSTSSSYIEISTDIAFKKKELGSSVCCNGVCLTVDKIHNKSIFFYLSYETLKKSNFRIAKLGDQINLEKSLIYGKDISGHYTQGHVDSTGLIKNIKIIDKTWFIKIEVNTKFKDFIIEKGSISINGVSLTITKIVKNVFEISIIPHTLKLTNLINLKINNMVNLEYDIFGKYIIKLKK
mgnify:CR=1 FL=1|tara:strand:- start:106 stop:690 length:585 start_codon:yes stop_codon:yes gene_type:complete